MDVAVTTAAAEAPTTTTASVSSTTTMTTANSVSSSTDTRTSSSSGLALASPSPPPLPSSSSVMASSANRSHSAALTRPPPPRQQPAPPLMHSVSIVVDLAKDSERERERENSLDLVRNHRGKDNLSKSIDDGGDKNDDDDDNDDDTMTSNFRQKTATETAAADSAALAKTTMTTITSESSSSSTISSAMIKSNSKTATTSCCFSGNAQDNQELVLSGNNGHSDDNSDKNRTEFQNIIKMGERRETTNHEEEKDDDDDDEDDNNSDVDIGGDFKETDNDEENGDEDDDEDEDGADCLRSELARKVVIVDEADKIFRNRAHSAEPRICIRSLEGKSPTLTQSCADSSKVVDSILYKISSEDELLFGGNQFDSCNQVGLEYNSDHFMNNSIKNKRSNRVASVDFSRLKEKYQDDRNLDDLNLIDKITQKSIPTSGDFSSTEAELELELEKAEKAGIKSTKDIENFSSSRYGSSREFVGREHGLEREREQSKLSMRRYTHHQVSGFTSPQSLLSSVSSSIYSNTEADLTKAKTLSNTLSSSGLPSIRSTINHSAVRAAVVSRPAARLGSAQLIGFSSSRIGSSSERDSNSSGSSSGSISKVNRNNNIAASSFDPLQSPSKSATATTTPPLTTTTTAISRRATISQQQQYPPHWRNNLTPTPSQQMKNWSQHRRQSLQISLLTGFASSSSQSISLTEEELRGEREFNEQLRLAKSPDIQAATPLPPLVTHFTRSISQHQPTYQQLQQTTTSPQSVSPNQILASSGGGNYLISTARTSKAQAFIHTRPRCESLAGAEIFSTKRQQHTNLASNISSLSSSSIVNNNNDNDDNNNNSTSSALSPSLLQELNKHKQATTTSKTLQLSKGEDKQFLGNRLRSTHAIDTDNSSQKQTTTQTAAAAAAAATNNKTRRRVSFGSIDPIQMHSEPRTHNRASFAYYPTYHQATLQYNELDQEQDQEKREVNSVSSLFSISPQDSTIATAGADNRCEKSISSEFNREETIVNKGRDSNLDLKIANYLSKQQQQHQQTTRSVGPQKRHSIATHNYIKSLAETSSATNKISLITKTTLIDQTSGDSTLPQQQQTQRVSVKNITDLFNTGKISQKDETGLIGSLRAPTSSNKSVMKMNENENNPTTTTTTTTPVETTTTTTTTSTTTNNQEDTNLKPCFDDHESQMETYSTKLEGQDTDDLGITSSTSTRMQVASSTQEKNDSKIRSIMANAKLRQEEFARLLEEHEQIVNEINRVETKISSSQTSLQQQLKQQQPQQDQENNQ